MNKNHHWLKKLKKNGILILLLSSIAVSIVSYLVQTGTDLQREESNQLMLHTQGVIQTSVELRNSLRASESFQRGYILTGNQNLFTDYLNAKQNSLNLTSQITTLTKDNASQQERIVIIRKAIEEFFNILDQTAQQRTDEMESLAEIANTIKQGTSRNLMLAVDNELNTLRTAEETSLEQRANTLDNSVFYSRLTLNLGTIFSIMILILGIRTFLSQAKQRIKTYQHIELQNNKLLFNEGSVSNEVDEEAVIGKLMHNLQNATNFIRKIGSQEYNETYLGYSDDNEMLNQETLAGALIEMRNKMKMVAIEERRRNWGTEGMALFADIMRKNNHNIEQLYHDITANLVRYLGANQAGLFIVNDEDNTQTYLELVACYAYDRRKYLDKRVEIGEGLIGQAYLEKDIIYLTEIPQNYIRITSGLGDAKPTCLLIVPLQSNEEILGVVEIASFDLLKEYQVEFVKKLAESMASTIASVRINDKTKRLLEASQQQAEELRAQEEEMRQNMEELAATQEEISRKEKDYQARIEELESQLINLN